MEVTPSARKHGVEDADIQHAWRNALRLVEKNTWVRTASWSSALTVTAGCWAQAPVRIIHADGLRPKFYDYLR